MRDKIRIWLNKKKNVIIRSSKTIVVTEWSIDKKVYAQIN